ncbi:MAG: hypothetical protein LBK59_07380 [Bifidobacteriaceae bacterium]|nr:hypothetical protein [Bifidobacteriaceae bacterium]
MRVSETGRAPALVTFDLPTLFTGYDTLVTSIHVVGPTVFADVLEGVAESLTPVSATSG